MKLSDGVHLACMAVATQLVRRPVNQLTEEFGRRQATVTQQKQQGTFEVTESALDLHGQVGYEVLESFQLAATWPYKSMPSQRPPMSTVQQQLSQPYDLQSPWPQVCHTGQLSPCPS